MENNETQNISIKIPRSETSDAVGNTYSIYLNEEVVELGNEFCKYFHAANDAGNTEFFAIIYENSFIPNIHAIDFLSRKHIEGLNNVLAYSIVPISTTKEDRFVVIVDSYDTDSTLGTQLQKGTTINLQEVENIISKANNVLANLQNEQIFCCNINPSNILMKNDKFFALREFIDTYPNFHQEEQYLAPELIECHKTARFIKNVKSDIYALGVSIFEAYANKTPWNDHPKIQEYNHARFENSTSKYLLERAKTPERLKVFLKWCLHDDNSIRWNTDRISEWVEGKNNKHIHESLTEVKNIIGFSDTNYSSLKSLSYALFNNWIDAMRFIKETKLFKWASREQLDSDTIDEIASIVDKKSESSFVVTNNLSSHIKLSKLLSLIDYNGSIRQEGLAISAASIPCFFHNLVINNNKDSAKKIIQIIKNEDWNNYSKKVTASGYLDNVDADNFINQIEGIKIGSAVKGIEKLSYSLNPTLTCQSKILKNKYINTIPELLVALDQYAEKNIKSFTVDKHIIAFISAKLDLKDEVKTDILPSFLKLSEHPVIRGLVILNLVQKHETSIEIPNICKAIAADLNQIFEEHLHNVEFKQQITSKIEEISKEGNLESIVCALSERQQFINDYNGYYEACKQASMIETRINELNNQDKVFDGALILGQKTTVLLSYILCFIVTITVII